MMRHAHPTGWRHAEGIFRSGPEALTVEHRYHFSSALKRMAAVVKLESAASITAGFWVVAKGAPEVGLGFLSPSHRCSSLNTIARCLLLLRVDNAHSQMTLQLWHCR